MIFTESQSPTISERFIIFGLMFISYVFVCIILWTGSNKLIDPNALRAPLGYPRHIHCFELLVFENGVCWVDVWLIAQD